jgi:ABC-type glycerol-3-phosphate transport system substrate-binding protein
MVVSASALLFATGCPNNTTPGTAAKEKKPFEGLKLKLAGADAGVAQALGSRARGWATRNGATVETVIADPTTVSDSDIVFVSPSGVGMFAEANDAVAVPKELTESLNHPGQWSGILPIYRDRLAAWAGAQCAVPLAGEGAVLVVRSDLLKDVALSEKYLTKFGRPLPSSPATWEDLAEIAEASAELHKAALPARSEEDKRTLRDFFRVAACYDRPALAQSDLERKDVSQDTVARLAFTHVADTGEPRLATPGFEAAARWMARVQPARLAANEDAAAALGAGKVSVAVLSLAELGRLPKDASGMVPATFAVLPLPGARTAYDSAGKPIDFAARPNYVPYFNGGWFGVVRKKCASPDAAFDLLFDLASPARSLELLSDPVLGFGPLRSEHLEQSREMVWQRYGFDAARTHQLADALRRNAGVALVNPAFGLRGPDAAELTAILNQSLDRPDGLTRAQAAWQERDAKNPAAKSWRRHAAGLH